MYCEITVMHCEFLIRLVHLYGAAAGLTPRTVSTYAAGSGDFCDRLERGHDITTRRAERVIQWFSDHWPEGLEWPSDIPRPAPGAKGKAAMGGLRPA